MANKIWIHINPVIKAADDATKKLLTRTLQSALEATTRDAIVPLLPPKLNANPRDKPTTPSKKWNALSLTATNTVKIEKSGSSAFVMCKVRILLEVIKTPDLKHGQPVGSGEAGAGTDGRGSDDASIARTAKATFAHFLKNLVDQIIRTGRHRAKQVGLEF